MATHSSILSWRIPWTEEAGGLQSMGLQRVGHDWATEHAHRDLTAKWGSNADESYSKEWAPNHWVHLPCSELLASVDTAQGQGLHLTVLIHMEQSTTHPIFLAHLSVPPWFCGIYGPWYRVPSPFCSDSLLRVSLYARNTGIPWKFAQT